MARYPKRPLTEFEGEYVKLMQGTSRKDFTCDLCGGDIGPMEKAYAFTIYTDRTPYSEWESIYLYRLKEV